PATRSRVVLLHAGQRQGRGVDTHPPRPDHARHRLRRDERRQRVVRPRRSQGHHRRMRRLSRPQHQEPLMSTARIRLPSSIKKGEVVEVKTLVTHVMESGQRRDAAGKVIPRKILNKFTCAYNGKEVFSAELAPAISANPYISFFIAASESGTLDFAWTDDDGS